VQYQAPYGPPGLIDPNASYINGDPTIGRPGSVPPASAFEYPQREIVNLITNSLQAATDQDLNQMTRAVRDGKLIFSLDSGPLNTVEISNFSPPVNSYTQGLTLHVLIAHTVTGPTTIAIGSLNPTSIKRRDGAELLANDMVAGQIATLVSDGTFFQLQNMGADGSTGGATTLHQVDIPYVHDTGALDPNWQSTTQVVKNHVIGLYSPVLPDINEGRTVEVKLDQVIQGPTDFAPNGFPIHPVAHPDGSPIVAGDGVPNQIWLLVFDSVQWQLLDVFNSGAQTIPAAPKAYDGRSLQLDPPGTPYYITGNTTSCLTRSPSLSTNRQVFTISAFAKLPVGPAGDMLFSAGDEGGTWWGCTMNWFGVICGGDGTGGNIFELFWANSGGQVAGIGSYQSYTGETNGYYTSGVFVDNKWHHVLIVADGAFLYAYLDGILKSKGSIAGNAPWNSTLIHTIGAMWDCTGGPLGSAAGYYASSRLRFAEVIGIDGQAIGDYTKFAVANNGILVPLDPSVIAALPFGTNGFYLNWQNGSDVTPTGLGKDFSGQNNNWTCLNLDLSHLQTDFPGKQQS
jgi:hypothetical protein